MASLTQTLANGCLNTAPLIHCGLCVCFWYIVLDRSPFCVPLSVKVRDYKTLCLMFEAFTFRVIFFPVMLIQSAWWVLLACVHTQRRDDVQANKNVEKQACCSVKVVTREAKYASCDEKQDQTWFI